MVARTRNKAMSNGGQPTDDVGRMLGVWKTELPDLDLDTEGIVERIRRSTNTSAGLWTRRPRISSSTMESGECWAPSGAPASRTDSRRESLPATWVYRPLL